MRTEHYVWLKIDPRLDIPWKIHVVESDVLVKIIPEIRITEYPLENFHRFRNDKKCTRVQTVDNGGGHVSRQET